MAGFNKNGLEVKPFNQILEEIVKRAKEEVGEDLPTTPDSPFGQLANIFSASHKDIWDLAQAVTDTQNRDTATGIYLDYIAGLVFLTRLKESGSKGDLLFTGRQSAIIRKFFAVKDNSNRNILTNAEVTLNRANCYQSTFSVQTLADNTDYTINVEGTEYTVNGGTSPTVATILNSLKVSLDVGTGFICTLVDETLILTFDSYNNNLTTTNSDSLSLDSVGSLVTGEAADKGNLDFPAGSVTKLVSSDIQVDSVENITNFVKGRAEETDEELRLRIAQREESAGTATKPAIEASLSEVEGVYSALVVPNNTLVDDTTTGVPAKSYEVFVAGGDDNEIAEVLWKTKHTTGTLHGNVTKTIIDRNGDTQAVKFSRNAEKFAWIKVTYNIVDTELFPSNGEADMESAVASYGNKMSNGEDLNPTKFYGPLYTVKGIAVSQIEIAVTATVGDTPIYQTTPIPVSDTEGLSFVTSRISVTT